MDSHALLMFVLACGIFVSLFFGKITALIDTSPELDDATLHSSDSSLSRQLNIAGWQRPSNGVISYSTTDDLLWFIQISDIHISIFQDPSRIRQLRHFVNETLPIIKPELVLASGDLTDSKNSDNIGSLQYEKEWQVYKDILVKGNVFNNSFWLDLRGNHDVFDVPSADSRRNWFRQYGVQGSAHPRSYLYTVARGRRRYAFIALDATVDPGPRRPFNFFGVVSPRELAALRNYTERARRSADHVVWFGHFPSSVIIPSGSVRRLMAGSLAYLCGHLHTLGGIVPQMYTRQRSGSLELELGDWKDARRYRLLAIDHGLLSITDVDSADQWPVVMVTSPKRAELAMPLTEPLWTMREMPHIRLLAFSVHEVVSVRVRLLPDGAWLPCVRARGPLYTCNWRPDEYSHGLHTMQVAVEDAGGLSRHVSHTFSLDGSTVQFPFLARMVLMLDMSTLFQFSFAMALLACALPPILLHLLHTRVTAGRWLPPLPPLPAGWRCVRRWLRRLRLFAAVDRLYWPHVVMLVYMPFGPWLVGEVITDRVGVVFAWGTFVGGAFVPGLLQYAFGLAQLLLFHLPLMLATGTLLQRRLDRLSGSERASRRGLWVPHGCLLVVCLVQLHATVNFYKSYDLTATILGPFRTWSLLIGLYMWRSAASLPVAALRRAATSIDDEHLIREPSD